MAVLLIIHYKIFINFFDVFLCKLPFLNTFLLNIPNIFPTLFYP